MLQRPYRCTLFLLFLCTILLDIVIVSEGLVFQSPYDSSLVRLPTSKIKRYVEGLKGHGNLIRYSVE